MDAIRIMLWIGNYSDYIYLMLGAIIGILFEHLMKRKIFYVKNKDSEFNSVVRRVPNILIIIIILLISIFSIVIIEIAQKYTLVPDVVGLTYEEAAAKLHSEGLTCSENYGRYGDVVTAVSPVEKYVRSGSMINLTLGRLTGAELDSEDGVRLDSDTNNVYDAIMPDVYMIQEQTALKYLKTFGFENVEILPQYTDTTVASYVLRSEPFAGEPINYTDSITLYVSVNEAIW